MFAFFDWLLLAALAFAVRGEVRRALSYIGTSAPCEDSGRVIWRGDGLENNRLVENSNF